MRATTHTEESHCPEHDVPVVVGFTIAPPEPDVGRPYSWIDDAWIESQECGCTFDAFAIAGESDAPNDDGGDAAYHAAVDEGMIQ